MTWERNTSGFVRTPPKWKSDPQTKAVRIPVSLVDEVLEIAHQIDDERVGESESKSTGDRDCDAAIAILTNALTLKANAGGKIKEQIRKALGLLQ